RLTQTFPARDASAFTSLVVAASRSNPRRTLTPRTAKDRSMSCCRRPLVRIVFLMVFGAGACARIVQPTLTPPGSDGGAADVPTAGGPAAPVMMDARPMPDLVIAETGGCTPSVTCTPANGQYCGVIGNGCFGMLDCGACPGDQVCDTGVCVGGASCVALAC